MALPRMVSLKDQANMIGNYLATQLAPSGAQVKILSNQRKMWQFIFDMTTSSKPLVLVCFNGETSRGGVNQRNTLHRVDREWIVVVMEGVGFEVDFNKTIPKEGKIVSFYDACEFIRQSCRQITSISEEPVDYVGMKPLPGVAQPNMANVFLDGYVITFLTANDIPAITNLAPGQDPEE